MSVVEDIERVQVLVAERGSDKQQAWFEKWGREFEAAVDRRDEDACEDLCLALIAFERLELKPRGKSITLDELIVQLGFDPGEFGDDTSA